jgi:hypothetical protein
MKIEIFDVGVNSRFVNMDVQMVHALFYKNSTCILRI